MSAPKDRSTRVLMVIFAGVASAGMFIGAIALLISAMNSRDRSPSGRGTAQTPNLTELMKPTTSPTGGGKPAVATAAKRFTLRLGQGFRFEDGVVVVAKPE